MAFQNLRSGNQLFILKKDTVPTLEIGKIANVSIPVPKYGNIYNSEMVVDVTVNIDNQVTNFQKLPALGDIADFGNNMVVSCSKDAMDSEINAMKQKSMDIVNSIDVHKDIIKGCDEILKKLNPEKSRQEEENKEIKKELNSLKELIKEFINGNNTRSTRQQD